jgi:hypothetical protein
MGVAILPNEAHSPLIVDPDRMLAGATAYECFEPIAGRNPQVFETRNRRQKEQFRHGSTRNFRRYAFRRRASRQRLRALVAKAADHFTGVP